MMRRRQPTVPPPEDVRVGLIARSDDRGLGHMTWEFARHLHPDRVLVIDLGRGSRFPNRLDRYPGATVVEWNPDTKRFVGRNVDDLVAEWLSGLQVLYSAETFYDWSIVDTAHRLGVATVLHLMPELFPKELPATPTQLWTPTSWRTEHLPADTLVVPVPVATDRFDVDPDTFGGTDGPLRVLHVAGRRAAADRNGTVNLYRALRQVRAEVAVTVTTQDSSLPALNGAGANVRLRTVPGMAVPDYWRLYDDQDVLVLPRKYGGLCLPAQEAAAAGLALVMTNTPPNDRYPARLADVVDGGTIETPCGHVPMVTADVDDLAALIDQLADPDTLRHARHTAYAWACRHSWEVLVPTYRELLNAAVRALWTESPGVVGGR